MRMWAYYINVLNEKSHLIRRQCAQVLWAAAMCVSAQGRREGKAGYAGQFVSTQGYPVTALYSTQFHAPVTTNEATPGCANMTKGSNCIHAIRLQNIHAKGFGFTVV